jgi:hypothetical protein
MGFPAASKSYDKALVFVRPADPVNYQLFQPVYEFPASCQGFFQYFRIRPAWRKGLERSYA